MNTFLLILAIILVVSGAYTKHCYKTDVCSRNPRFAAATQRKIPWFLGSVLSFATEAICWWYIITQLFIK